MSHFRYSKGYLFKINVLFICSVLISCDTPNEYDTKQHPNKELNYIAENNSILTPTQALGKKLFFDSNLSTPKGQSCASCHIPTNGFGGLNDLPASEGALKKVFGSRNSPSIAYAAFTPYFQFDSVEQNYFGGLFWDGRVNTLSEQAKFPLLNHLEMNNSNISEIISKIKQQTTYRSYFENAYGPNILSKTDTAIFTCVTEAIEEYEETAEVSPFTSKFDYYLKGLVKLDPIEERGLNLFNDKSKGNCAACHPSTKDKLSNAVLFTDYTYDNTGAPKNTEHPYYKLSKQQNPLGIKYIDYGLGAILKKRSENGKFKVPTLRNIALTAPYFHNGVFKTLKQTVHFYNSRDVEKFPTPEVLENINKDEMGNLKLTDDEENAIVAFLNTLTDGYVISKTVN